MNNTTIESFEFVPSIKGPIGPRQKTDMRLKIESLMPGRVLKTEVASIKEQKRISGTVGSISKVTRRKFAVRCEKLPDAIRVAVYRIA